MFRKLEEAMARALMMLATLAVVASLLWIVGTIGVKGLPALSLDMVTKGPGSGYYLGGGGGVLNAIVGSLLLAGGAVLLAAVVGMPVALYLNVFLKQASRRALWVRLSLDVLCGVPSIVYGAFGFTLMLWMGLRASLLGGMITVALLILPAMIRAADEVLRLAPRELAEASYAVGATRWETALKVMVRQTRPGLASAVLLAFGRGIGDAASVLFTAGFTDRVSFSLLQPAATLPLAIFFQLGTPLAEVQARAYASALILTALILGVSLGARALAARSSRNVLR